MEASTNDKNKLFVVCLLIALIFSGCEVVAPRTVVLEVDTIAEIQGRGHYSPFAGHAVNNVHGIVTAVRSNGFFMQSVKADDDPATSEGIFVFKGLLPSVRPGDEVLVNAMVDEWVPGGEATGNLSITQLRYPQVVIISQGNPLPAPVIIGFGGRMPPTELVGYDPDALRMGDTPLNPEKLGLDFYESLEGMLVQVNEAVVVGPTNQYNEIVILPDRGRWANVRTPRDGIIIRENDFNPERIILADEIRQMPFLNVGDYSTEPIIGVIDYSYGNYKLQPIAPVEFTPGVLVPSEALSAAKPGQLRIASYNVENLSAIQPERIMTLADQIVNLMASPDIIAFQEILDNDGSIGSAAISADQTYQGIIDAIQLLDGPPYGFVDIDPLPGEDGGVLDGNIRVGVIYRLDTGLVLFDAPRGDSVTAIEIVDIDGSPVPSLNPGRIDPANPAFLASRKPLVVTFDYHDMRIFVVNVHFNSKFSDSPLFGAIQPLMLNSEVQRLQQALVVHDLVSKIKTIAPDSHIVVLGDLNDFQFSASVQALQGDFLYNLMGWLPEEERYTYIYQGNSQALDHILVSDRLFEKLVAFDILHINAEFHVLSRFSDHDALVATFTGFLNPVQK